MVGRNFVGCGFSPLQQANIRVCCGKDRALVLRDFSFTAVRTLESAWQVEAATGQGSLHAGAGRTSIFIHPGESGHRFRVVVEGLTYDGRPVRYERVVERKN